MKKQVWLGALLYLLISVSAFAQSTGTINGRVTDATGGAVPGATVTITSTTTGVSRNSVTNSEGLYNVSALQPGVYDVKVEMKGFAPSAKTGVTLTTDTTLAEDFSLGVAGTTQQVEVAGEAPLVETTQSEVSGSLQTSEVQSLPILNRNFTGLVELIPGARNSPVSNPTKAALGNGISFGGGAGRNVETNVDGLDNRDDIIGGPMMNFTLEGIQEFKLIAHEFGAQYGRTNGAILQIVTKAGTNRIDGSAFAFGRNDAMTSTDYFSNPANGGLGKPSYSRENFGGSFGGPIKKDKLFFFGAVERTQQNFVQSEPVALYNQMVILAQAITTLGIVPAQTVPIPLRDTLYTLKGDYQINAHHSLFVRWAQELNHQDNDLILTNHPDLSVPTIDPNHFWSIVGSETWIIGNNSVNTVAFQSNRMDSVTGVAGTQSLNASQIAPNAPITHNLIFPSITAGQPSATNQRFLQKKIQFKDDFSHQMGKHSLKFGVDYAWYPKITIILDIGTRGSLNFLDNPSTIVGSQAAWAANPGTCTNATLVTGSPTACGREPQGFSTPGILSSITIGTAAPHIGGPEGDSSIEGLKQFGTYVQDDWRVNPRLTLNLGLRYDIGFNWFDQREMPQSRELAVFKAIGSPYAALPQTPLKDVSPRVGFSWDVTGDGKNVVRGGFGLYFDQPSQSYAFTAYLHAKPTVSSAITYVAGQSQVANYVYNPNPATLPPGPTALPTQLPIGASGTYWDAGVRDPYNEQAHIGYTRQISPSMIISADYTHILGLHEFRFGGGFNVNPLDNHAWDPTTNCTASCPRLLASQFTNAFGNPNYLGAITINSSSSRSQFNELIVHFERRAKRVTLQGTYTLANADGFGGCIAGGGGSSAGACTAASVNQLQPYAPTEWGPTNTDERHRIVLSSVINLPWGIQVSPIFQAGSARPYNLTEGIDCNGDGTANDRLFVSTSTGAPVTCGSTGAGQPAGTTLVGLNSKRGDPTWDFDARVSKFFNFGETRKLGFFAEFYNITNHANFGNTYSGALTAGALFEKPTGYLAGFPTSRQMQLGARFTF